MLTSRSFNMIMRDRLQILDGLMTSAKQVLETHKSVADTAVRALEQAKVYMLAKDTNPQEVINLYNRIHQIDMETLTTLNSIIERFPVEHTVQELQVLETFRNLSERQRQDLMTYLERLVLTKGKK